MSDRGRITETLELTLKNKNNCSAGNELAAAQLEYFDVMRGPWDRQDHHNPFAVNLEKPEGAGYYPEDLDRESWDSYLEEHPGQRAEFESLFTVITSELQDILHPHTSSYSPGFGKELRAENYSTFFQEWLHPAHGKMVEAAQMTDNESLKTFLTSRAAAFLSNDYYQSDKDWMDLDSKGRCHRCLKTKLIFWGIKNRSKE